MSQTMRTTKRFFFERFANQNVILARETINHVLRLICVWFFEAINDEISPKIIYKKIELRDWKHVQVNALLLRHFSTHISSIFLKSFRSSRFHVYDNYFKAVKIYCPCHQLLLLPVFTILIRTNNSSRTSGDNKIIKINLYMALASSFLSLC